jgi:hypothetical protein
MSREALSATGCAAEDPITSSYLPFLTVIYITLVAVTT